MKTLLAFIIGGLLGLYMANSIAKSTEQPQASQVAKPAAKPDPAMTEADFTRLAALLKENANKKECAFCNSDQVALREATKHDAMRLEKAKARNLKSKEEKEQAACKTFEDRDMKLYDQKNLVLLHALERFEVEDRSSFFKYLILEKKLHLNIDQGSAYFDFMKSNNAALQRFIAAEEAASQRRKEAKKILDQEQKEVREKIVAEYEAANAAAQKRYDDAVAMARSKLGISVVSIEKTMP